MTQGELFEIIEQICENGIVCIKCDILQPIENFQRMNYTKTKNAEIKRTCKSCASGHKKVIEELRQSNPYPTKDYLCAICERSIEEVNKHKQKLLGTWVLDHCHETNTFRGYVCKHCNTGLGGFKDSLDTVKKAVRYLEKHKEKLSENNT